MRNITIIIFLYENSFTFVPEHSPTHATSAATDLLLPEYRLIQHFQTTSPHSHYNMPLSSVSYSTTGADWEKCAHRVYIHVTRA